MRQLILTVLLLALVVGTSQAAETEKTAPTPAANQERQVEWLDSKSEAEPKSLGEQIGEEDLNSQTFEQVPLEPEPVRATLETDKPASQEAKLESSAPMPTRTVFEYQNKMDIVKLFHGLYYQQAYKKINSYLVDKVETADPMANIQAAREWLEREKKSGVWLIKNRATVEALEQFVALANITDKNRCNRNSYAIIWKNDRATEGRAHVPPTKIKMPLRVDSIVHQFALKHAIDCHYIYPRKYIEIRASLDPISLRHVEAYFNAIVSESLPTTERMFFFETRRSDSKYYDPNATLQRVQKKVGNKQIGQISYDFIKAISVDDPDRRFLNKVIDEKQGKMTVNQAKVHALVERYLVQPCEYYLHELGPDVFIPARYDARMLEKEDRYTLDDETITRFMIGWVHYRLCEQLVRSGQSSLKKNVVWMVGKN